MHPSSSPACSRPASTPTGSCCLSIFCFLQNKKLPGSLTANDPDIGRAQAAATPRRQGGVQEAGQGRWAGRGGVLGVEGGTEGGNKGYGQKEGGRCVIHSRKTGSCVVPGTASTGQGGVRTAGPVQPPGALPVSPPHATPFSGHPFRLPAFRLGVPGARGTEGWLSV